MRRILSLAILLVAGTAQVALAAPTEGDAAAGQALFTGSARPENGGPACASCHNTAGLPFPHGGDMGPDLTDEYSKLGPDGLRYTLATLYFPAMNPLFIHHPLSRAEQADLTAFFRSVDHRRPIATGFSWLLMAGLIGLGVLVILTGIYGRKRIRSVRRALLARVARERQR